MKKLVLVGAIVFTLFTTDVVAGPERVKLHEDYQNTFTHYAVINRPEKNQVTHCYANRVAVESAKPGQPLAMGSVLVMEVYKAKMDDKGMPISNDRGKYVKDSLAAIVVMEKQEGWGASFPEKIRNGDWDYAKYKPGKNKPVNKDNTKCLECHKRLEPKDFVFSFDDLIGVKK